VDIVTRLEAARDRTLKCFEVRIQTSDPRTYVIVLIAIFLVATLATYIPARRASSIDPMTALHSA